MHRLFLALIIVVFVAVMTQPISAFAMMGSRTVIARATAQVVERLSVLARTPLMFGYIVPGSKGGTITVGTNHTRRTSGRVKVIPGLYERAMFIVRGTPNRSYSMHVPQSLTIKAIGVPRILAKGKVSELTARDFTTYSYNSGSNTNTGHLGRLGFDTIFMGGTLVVPDNVAPGFYSALVPLTVSY